MQASDARRGRVKDNVACFCHGYMAPGSTRRRRATKAPSTDVKRSRSVLPAGQRRGRPREGQGAANALLTPPPAPEHYDGGGPWFLAQWPTCQVVSSSVDRAPAFPSQGSAADKSHFVTRVLATRRRTRH